MTVPKLYASPARLAELALENGWSAEEVASTFASIVGPAGSVEVTVHRSPATSVLGRSETTRGSTVLRDAFARVRGLKR